MHQEKAEEFMSTSNRHIAGRAPLAARAAVVATWMIFGAAVLLLDAPGPRGIYYLINVVGLVGLCVSIAWFILSPRWRTACASVSVLFVLVYVMRWYLQVDEVYKTDPTLGVGTAIGRVLHVWAAVFESNRAKYGVTWALLAVYWDVLIAPVQVLVAAFLFSSRSSGNQVIAKSNS